MFFVKHFGPTKLNHRSFLYNIVNSIDDDVLEEFRNRADASGRGYQTIMNQVLREYLAKSNQHITENTLRRVIREELRVVKHTAMA